MERTCAPSPGLKGLGSAGAMRLDWNSEETRISKNLQATAEDVLFQPPAFGAERGGHSRVSHQGSQATQKRVLLVSQPGEVRSALECGGTLVQEVSGMGRAQRWVPPGKICGPHKSEFCPGYRTLRGAWCWIRAGGGPVETYLRRAVRSSCVHMWLRAHWGLPPHSSPGMGCRHAPGEPRWITAQKLPGPGLVPYLLHPA